MLLHLHDLYYNLGCVLHQQGDLEGAAASYRRSLALQPNYVAAHHNLGIVLGDQGQWCDAIRHYQQAIALRPNHVGVLSNLGVALVKQGQFEAAVKLYHKAIAHSPHWATLHNNLGQALLAQGRVEDAIAAYRHALHLQPNAALAHHNLGKAWQHKGQHAQAVACFEQAIQLNPTLVAAYSNCATSLMALGQWSKAMASWQQAIAKDSDFIHAYCAWVSTLSDDDELNRAKISCGRFLQALQHDCADATDAELWDTKIWDYLAQTCVHWGNVFTRYGGDRQYRQAETLYQRALHLQPEHIDHYLRLGHCLTQQGRPNATILVYHTALILHPTHPQLYMQLGQALECQGQWERAIACYRQALELHQTHPSSFTFHPSPFTLHPAKPSPTTLSLDSTTPSPCDGLNCVPCLNRIVAWFQPIHLGDGVHRLPEQGVMPVGATPPFVKRIAQGRAWTAPQQNNWLICNGIATFTAAGELLPDLSRCYPAQLPGCQTPMLPPSFPPQELPPLRQVQGTVATLTGLSGQVYFHWMTDILPRFDILRQAGIDLNQIDWFWVNSQQHPFQRETLRRLGIPNNKVLESDRSPHIQADHLIVPSFPGYLGWTPLWALEFLRREFLPIPPPFNFPERIYISRDNACYRRVLNEPEVLDQLSRLGFVSVHLESLPLEQQIALFAQATVIVAPHGSGLTNLIFCRPGTTIVEFISPHYIRHYYWVISRHLGLFHFFLVGRRFTCQPIRDLMYQNPLTEDIWVDQTSLQRMMTAINLAD